LQDTGSDGAARDETAGAPEEERRWRKKRFLSVPSPSSAFRFLAMFHEADQHDKRVERKAFIPIPNGHLQGLAKVNKEMLPSCKSALLRRKPPWIRNATLVETAKQDALFGYKGFKSYQPLNTWWAEHQIVLHTEFRDGNVPAGHEQLRVLKESLSLLPEGVEKVRLRSEYGWLSARAFTVLRTRGESAVWPD